MNSIQYAAKMMWDHPPLLPITLRLHLTVVDITIYSNRELLLDQLHHYFRHLVENQPVSNAKKMEVIVIERDPLQFDLPWQDWVREEGKVGRKDTFIDGDGFRLIRKVRTGMLFLQSVDRCIVAGRCERNCNQVVNFIINQQMTVLQQRNWLICHASSAVNNGRALALAASSGGGKSTSMLRLMLQKPWNFVTNDRLFIKEGELGVEAEGVPKLPRINPGTLLHNPQLRTILSPQRITELEQMSTDALWSLEEKYDVDVVDRYGAQRIQHHVLLSYFVILNWSHSSKQPTSISRINLERRPELLQVIMKSPGPFYQHHDGSFHQHATPVSHEAYLDVLKGVDVFEVQGNIDFSYLCQFCNRLVGA